MVNDFNNVSSCNNIPKSFFHDIYFSTIYLCRILNNFLIGQTLQYINIYTIYHDFKFEYTVVVAHFRDNYHYLENRN